MTEEPREWDSEPKEKMGGVHTGHRRRMRERFVEQGMKGFAPHEMLELLLYHVIPYRDTNELAHRLLDHFGGSFARVLEATPQALMEVPGISYNAAILIAMQLPMLRLYHSDSQRDRPVLDRFSRAKDFVRQQFLGLDREHFVLICLDPRARVVAVRTLSTGSVMSVRVPTRLVVEEAIRFGACRVIFAHNHPGGISRPSSDDILYTSRVGSVLRALDIHLDDHIIVGANEDDVTSLKRENYLNDAFLASGMPHQELPTYHAEL